MGYIYKIVNNINGKVYIGKTDFTIEERWKNHIHDCKNKSNLKIVLFIELFINMELNIFILKW